MTRNTDRNVLKCIDGADDENDLKSLTWYVSLYASSTRGNEKPNKSTFLSSKLS